MLTTIPVPETVNDFTVLASHPLENKPGREPGHAVLCDRGPGQEHERFVTWLISTPDEGQTWHAFWGHYFTDLAEAVDDLPKRTD